MLCSWRPRWMPRHMPAYWPGFLHEQSMIQLLLCYVLDCICSVAVCNSCAVVRKLSTINQCEYYMNCERWLKTEWIFYERNLLFKCFDRFANIKMKMNDPLQTLFQIMSGRQPAAATVSFVQLYWRHCFHFLVVICIQKMSFFVILLTRECYSVTTWCLIAQSTLSHAIHLSNSLWLHLRSYLVCSKREYCQICSQVATQSSEYLTDFSKVTLGSLTVLWFICAYSFGCDKCAVVHAGCIIVTWYKNIIVDDLQVCWQVKHCSPNRPVTSRNTDATRWLVMEAPADSGV